MSKPFVVVATPCFGGLVNQTYMLSVLKLVQLAAGGEFELDVVLMGGDSLITRSRSVLVSRFLDNPRATHLMHLEAMRLALWQESIGFLRGDDAAQAIGEAQ